jgi:hypothetical protein
VIYLHCVVFVVDPDMWKRLADQLGIRRSQLGFYVRKENPVKGALEDTIRKRRLTVGELYDILWT